MKNLKDISTFNFLLEQDYQKLPNCADLQVFLSNVDKLDKRKIKKTYSMEKIHLEVIKKHLEEARVMAETATFNPKIKYQSLFNSDNELYKQIGEDIFIYTDENTSALELLYGNKLNNFYNHMDVLKDLSIADIKKIFNNPSIYNDLEHFDAHKLARALRLYELQVLRQAKYTSLDTKNLFYNNFIKKYTLFMNEQHKFYDLLNSSEETPFMWGIISPEEAKLIKNSYPTIMASNIEGKFIDTVINYTSLDDYEDTPGNYYYEKAVTENCLKRLRTK